MPEKNVALEVERVGFFKQSLVAMVANYWSRNPSVDFDEIVNRSAILTEKIWQKILEDRSGKHNS